MSSIEYITVKEMRARRSVETKRLSSGTTSIDKPFYVSRDDSGTHRASIYNDTQPKERHYVDGIETDVVQFSRGEEFSDCFYDEGCDHTASYVQYDIINHY